MYEAAKKPAWTWDFLSTPAYKYVSKNIMELEIVVSCQKVGTFWGEVQKPHGFMRPPPPSTHLCIGYCFIPSKFCLDNFEVWITKGKMPTMTKEIFCSSLNREWLKL